MSGVASLNWLHTMGQAHRLAPAPALQPEQIVIEKAAFELVKITYPGCDEPIFVSRGLAGMVVNRLLREKKI